MAESSAIVVIIDDDVSVSKSLRRLLQVHGYATHTCTSAEAFLAEERAIQAACLILDLKMPGIDGMELQHRLVASGADTTVIFLTGHGDIPTSVEAMKLGAVDFLTKPVNEENLMKAVAAAMERYEYLSKRRVLADEVAGRLARLTRREAQVMQGVTSGATNKLIAAQLGISEKTVKAHRANVMQKLQVGSVAELVRLCGLADLLPANPAVAEAHSHGLLP